ncbi:uncharacterized protein B0H64DRAFT_21284 [Chaetomium fimeti]|uniref:Uncharacterized protein n=1 Tax=Chaetomium fimeti TaxID=1854472 RepID=A0AAE0HQ55_9PEZI|nr:hypothetical protein B0H64DRAFT_21284 [Chaetomium fimeti]
MCLNIAILDGCTRFGQPNPSLSFTKPCNHRAAQLGSWTLGLADIDNNGHQGCSNPLPAVFLSPTSSCSCTNGLVVADMAPPTQLRFFLRHAAQGVLAQGGALMAWPSLTAWSQADTDFLANNLIACRRVCARDTVMASEFGEEGPSLDGVYTNQEPQAEWAMAYPDPAAEEDHTANHVFGDDQAPFDGAKQLGDGNYPVAHLEEGNQSLGDDQPAVGNQAGPSSAPQKWKRGRIWSQEDMQLLLDRYAEKDARGKKVWTYQRMIREIPQFQDRTRNALESKVYELSKGTKNETE